MRKKDFITVIILILLNSLITNAIECPEFTHLETTEGNPSDVPEGFFVHGIYGKNGIFISPLGEYSPLMLPLTGSDTPSDISISANVKWILYNTGSAINLVRLSSACKIQVPIVSQTTENVCFWRNQPNGENAICYLQNRSTVRAITIHFDNDTVSFGSDRVIVSLSDSLQIRPGRRFCVLSNQFFSAMHPLIAGSYSWWETVYLTLPENGLGIAKNGNELVKSSSMT